MYPILFRPIYKEMIWGGTKMRDLLGRELPFDRTGESWDIACRANEMSVVENGPLAGKTLAELMASNRAAYLGKHETFTLLVKIIDANDDLSVQVHPSDGVVDGRTIEGKSEMWYIMDAPEGQSIVLGLKPGTTPAMLRTTPNDCLHRVPVRQGDMVDIPAGLVHALTRGVMVAEIQQNSDTTYRLYDYDRPGLGGQKRELHIEQGVAVADFDRRLPTAVVAGRRVDSDFFVVEKVDLTGESAFRSNPDAYSILTAVEGDCSLCGDFAPVTVAYGRSVFIPAGLGAYTASGRGTLLKSHAPI